MFITNQFTLVIISRELFLSYTELDPNKLDCIIILILMELKKGLKLF